MIRNGMMALVFVAAGCAGTQEEQIPAGVDENALADIDPAKADIASGWYVKNKGAIACAETKTTKTGPAANLDGYTVKLVKGAMIGFDAGANRSSRLLVYGPQKNGRWGSVRVSDWLSWNANAAEYHTTIKYVAPEEGKYLVVIGSYSHPAVRYSLSYYCDGAPHCAEYVSTNEDGTSLQNFYAINVNSYQEGKDHIAALNGQFVDENIRPGTCAEQSGVCEKIYLPVCAADITPDVGPEPAQFGNLCEFKHAVRQASAGIAGAKGHWDNGECGAPQQCTPGEKSYIGTPETCPLIRYTCDFDRGFGYFQDDQGCGCECKDLHWYQTCGTPVCMAENTSPEYLAIPVCDGNQVDGNVCGASEEGAYCRPATYDCGRLIQCMNVRPVVCPRSQRDKKRDIKYLDDAQLQSRAKELLAVKLATYQYKDAPATSPHRLGFIIEDKAPSVSVDEKREHVDVYGYTSLAVATIQVQQKQIDALKAELAEIKAQLARRAAR
jgi:hypothetical protein